MNRNNGLKSFALVAAVFLILSWLRLDPGSDAQGVSTGPADNAAQEELVDEEAVADSTAEAGGSGATSSSGGGPTTQAKGATTGSAECAAGKNGGATDTGVTANRIKLATTAVLDGPAKSLLEDSPVAMKAVIDKVNKSGGICGRLLDLTVKNDSFRNDVGLSYIKNFIAEGYFALPVVPSAEGLGSAIEAGEIRKAKIPVIGTDGMRNEQYTEPYVWPIAAATVTSMRVMAKYAYTQKQAKTFALVYDDKYKFGKEGAEAFVAQVGALGGRIVSKVKLDPEKPSYSSDATDFNNTCAGGGCDMIALLLLPDTAKKWLSATTTTRAAKYTAGAQTLFTDRFAQDCVLQYGDQCHGFAVWTGFNPPIGTYASLPGVASYVSDVRAVKPGIDVNNQFVEGAYLGMSVFVEALKRTGANLTRQRLAEVMDSMTYTSELSSALTWRPGKHSANVRSQSFSMTVSQKTFRGWRNEGTGFLLDPAFGG